MWKSNLLEQFLFATIFEKIQLISEFNYDHKLAYSTNNDNSCNYNRIGILPPSHCAATASKLDRYKYLLITYTSNIIYKMQNRFTIFC